MPTGYTNPILTGEITNFKDFAKYCMRNFGATIHMRDESLDVEYVKREPSDYYINSLKESEKELTEFISKTDDEITADFLNSYESDKKYSLSIIEEMKENKKKLKNILHDVRRWIAPTSEHINIKYFMEEQISNTIDHDCDISYYVNRISDIQNAIDTFNIEKIKKDRIEYLNDNIKRLKKEIEKEIERCKESNDWVETLLKSIEDYQNNKF